MCLYAPMWGSEWGDAFWGLLLFFSLLHILFFPGLIFPAGRPFYCFWHYFHDADHLGIHFLGCWAQWVLWTPGSQICLRGSNGTNGSQWAQMGPIGQGSELASGGAGRCRTMAHLHCICATLRHICTTGQCKCAAAWRVCTAVWHISTAPQCKCAAPQCKHVAVPWAHEAASWFIKWVTWVKWVSKNRLDFFANNGVYSSHKTVYTFHIRLIFL